MDKIVRFGKLLSAVCAAALVFAPLAPAMADTAAGEGVGTYACSEFLRASAADPGRKTLYFSWAQGWMTGWNLAQMDASRPTVDLKARPVPDQQAFIRAYCAAHPAALYMEAVYRLYVSLKPGFSPRPGGK
ncbi:MAG TPA: HdeA/HdeB family chaperone [Caulobacteraceae bacterium]|jgi:hypothetical protein|nr:HdeA/HdeB family chaperone [Caulobacteraceae bacterium]